MLNNQIFINFLSLISFFITLRIPVDSYTCLPILVRELLEDIESSLYELDSNVETGFGYEGSVFNGKGRNIETISLRAKVQIVL